MVCAYPPLYIYREEQMMNTKLLYSLVWLICAVVAIPFLAGSIASAHTTTPTVMTDRLEIVRTPGIHSNITHKMVSQSQLVQDIYAHMLALPVAPTDQICPQYIIADYQLTFFSKNTVVQKANALKGQCQPVTIGNDDIRTADPKFWSLMSKATTIGTDISTSTGGTVPSRSTSE